MRTHFYYRPYVIRSKIFLLFYYFITIANEVPLVLRFTFRPVGTINSNFQGLKYAASESGATALMPPTSFVTKYVLVMELR